MSNWEVEAMADKKSFVAYYSWWDVIDKLDDHQKALVLEAMFSIGGVCEKPELDLVAEIAFIPIEREIQANAEKWEETRRRKSEGAKKARAKEKAVKESDNKESSTNLKSLEDTSSNLKIADDTSSNLTVDVDADVDVDVDVDVDADVDVDVVNKEKRKKEKVVTASGDCSAECSTAVEPLSQKSKKEANAHFEKLWALYPSKKGKNLISDKRKRDLLSVSIEEMQCFINRYKRDIELDHNNGFARQWLNGSTWFNGRWQYYTDENYQPAPKIKAIGKGKEYRYMSNEENRDFSHLEE